jgi:MFS family permease
MLSIGLFCTSLLFGPQNAAIQAATPNRMRGQVTALVLFGFNVIGVGLGPSILAFLTDFVFRDESQIRYALAACYAVISPIAFVILWSGLKPYGRRIAQLEEEEHAKSIG